MSNSKASQVPNIEHQRKVIQLCSQFCQISYVGYSYKINRAKKKGAIFQNQNPNPMRERNQITEISEILEMLQHGGFLLENQLDGFVGVVGSGGGHEESFEEVVGADPDVRDQAGGT